MKRVLLGAALLVACEQRSNESLKSLAPKPLPMLAAPSADGGTSDRDAVFRLALAPVFGLKPPANVVRVRLTGESVKVNDRVSSLAQVPSQLGGAPVLLESDPDTFLAQAAPLFALLDDSGAEVWLAHPNGKVAFKVVLRDEAAFQEWLDEAKPGKVRVIHREDGYELQTNIGKLPGADPNGPSVPVRGGKMDIASLRRGLELLKQRFDTAPDVCFVPSFGMELSKIAESLSADFRAMNEPIFSEPCLVYPRPHSRDGGR